jgi:hypothetical protein
MSREYKSCIYFDLEGSKYYGKCLRYPPQISIDTETDAIISAFPEVKFSNWCGEYRR